MTTGNPYHHRATNPNGTRLLTRAHLADPILNDLLAGENVILVGARGTGKTVLVEQLRGHICSKMGAHAVVLRQPPPEKSVPSVLREILRLLDLSAQEVRSVLAADPLLPGDIAQPDELTDARLNVANFSALLRAICDLRGYETLVLMFDELDHYALGGDHTSLAREFFNRMENWGRDLKPRIAVLAAGGIGVLGLSSRIGSQFAADARWHQLAPFDASEVEELVRPFLDDGRALDHGPLGALRLFSGYHPELFVYGLEHLWTLERSPRTEDVDPIYADFVERSIFVEEYWRSITAPQVSEAGRLLLDAVRNARGSLSQKDASTAVSKASGTLDLTVRDVLRLLVAAGLIRLHGPMRADPISVTMIPSILQPNDARPTACADLRSQLVADVIAALMWFREEAPDFFDGGTTQDALVPEATFSSFIAFGLRKDGWKVQREQQGGAGYADIRASHPRFDGEVVVEVKTWGEKNDYEKVHQQVLDYWPSVDGAGVVVMLRATEPRVDWPDDYVTRCLAGKASSHQRLADRPPLVAHFEARSPADGGREATVDHLLLRIPRPVHGRTRP